MSDERERRPESDDLLEITLDDLEGVSEDTPPAEPALEEQTQPLQPGVPDDNITRMLSTRETPPMHGENNPEMSPLPMGTAGGTSPLPQAGEGQGEGEISIEQSVPSTSQPTPSPTSLTGPTSQTPADQASEDLGEITLGPPEPADEAPEDTSTTSDQAEDVLIIDFGDEEEEELTPPPSPRPANSLEITLDDLDNFEAQSFTAVDTHSVGVPSIAKKQPESVVTQISYRSLLQATAAGLFGAFLGWIITEPLQSAGVGGMEIGELLRDIAIFAGVVGACIGFAMGASSWLGMGAVGRAARAGALGALIGAIGGVLGGCLAQYIYGALSLKYSITGLAQLLLRSVGWSMMGLFFGLGQSALMPEEKKMRNGIIGGALGGLVGGIAFQMIQELVQNDTLGRWLALSVVGISIGLFMGLIEEVAKEAWVRVVAGPLKGKQFILYQDRTTIGSSGACDIPLFKDARVASRHAVIENQRTAFVLRALVPQSPVGVNGHPVSRHVLRDSETITVGITQFEFHERLRVTSTT